MKIRIEIDAGERQAEFVRKPMTISDNPSLALVDHLVEAYCEARAWLETGQSLTGKDT